METPVVLNLISTNPDVRGGKPCIAGTGIRVSDVAVTHLLKNLSPDEIAVQYAVPLSGVYAALAFYYEHKADIDDDLRRQSDIARELKAEWEARGGRSILSR